MTDRWINGQGGSRSWIQNGQNAPKPLENLLIKSFVQQKYNILKGEQSCQLQNYAKVESVNV